ncbi:MAG: hypothetical protein MK193_11260 [Lentisphaeria bacterium]|nr:hypothetical protein [Lentisphaeria bacterium]
MIKLSTGTLDCSDETGQIHTIHLGIIEDELWDLCQQLSIDDAELPLDIVRVLKTYIQQQDNFHPNQIPSILFQLIKDSGLLSLSEAYRKDLNPKLTLPEELIRTNYINIEQVLSKDPYFASFDVGKLSSSTLNYLQQLKFLEASASLIISLAKNTVYQLEFIKTNPEETTQEKYWLLNRSEILPQISGNLHYLLEKSIIRVRSVSILFPVITVTLDCEKLLHKYDEKLLSELGFIPRVESILPDLSKLLSELEKIARERLVNTSQQEVPIKLKVKKLDEIVHRNFNGEPKTFKSFFELVDRKLKESLINLPVEISVR